tara:strand:- start:737 stop:2005 length:1269 start_codon:yes stop_codon:yes gene_type:complete
LKELNLNFNNMAIDFYELGKRGAKTPKGQQSGFEAFMGGATKGLEDMLNASKAATATLTAAMPAGVPIDKVPEELRGQVTEYLTNNKKAYTDATSVIASGINPQSQRYKDAIETINGVNSKFENLSNTLEDIAVKRKQALDDPNFSPATIGIDRLTFENLQNGSLYSSMTLNEDGTFNYKDGAGASKAWSDFTVAKQNFIGQQAYIGAVKEIKEYKRTTEGGSWNDIKGTYQLTFDTLFNKLGPKGSADFAFADDKFLDEKFQGQDLDVLRNNPTEVISTYKDYVMEKLENEYTTGLAFKKPTVQMSAFELAKQAKQRQGKKQFDEFMKTSATGKKVDKFGNSFTLPPQFDSPSPEQIATELSNILGPTRLIKFNPDKEDKGFYYVRASDGEKHFWRKVAPEGNIQWDDVKGIMDFSNLALN